VRRGSPAPAARSSARSGLVVGDVDRALAEGSIVLTWSLRGTRHYHRAADVRWLLDLFGPVFGRPGRRARQLGIDGSVGDQAVRALRRALDSGPLTRPQVRELLAPVGVDPSGQAPVHVLFRAACEGVLCVVPGPRAAGGERYVLLDDWVPPGPPPPDPAAELARRYLTAFGPATPADLAAWSGLPAGVVREGWSALAGDLVEVARPGGDPAWVLADRAGVLDGPEAGPAPVRMLGGFDTFLLGYADRSLHLPPEHSRTVNAGGGIVRPVVLDDGRVVATWSLDRRRTPEVTPYPGEHPDTAAEVADIARFLGS
jgi:hypothetical protein